MAPLLEAPAPLLAIAGVSGGAAELVAAQKGAGMMIMVASKFQLTDIVIMGIILIGIIGYGNIARALHDLLRPFNVHVLAYETWRGDRYLRQQGVEPVSLEALMAQSRVVFALAAPSKENQAMLSHEVLMQLQVSAVLVLASRAHIVDFDALTEMVLARRFKVATDVFPTDPPANHRPRLA